MNLQDLINSISDANVKQLVLDGKWSEALDSANVNDKDVVAQVFLTTLKENQWKNYANKLTNSEKVILKWIKELGVREANNPYLQFIPKYFSKQNAQLSENNAVALNNLYASDVIDFADIAGTGESAGSHVIFNPNLYNLNMSDLEFIVKAYQSLGEENFVKKLNLNAIASNLSKEDANRIALLAPDIEEGDDKAIKILRYIILYNSKTKQLRSKYDVEKLLSAGENTAKGKSTNATTKVSKDFNSLSADDKKTALKSMFPQLNDSQLDTLYTMTNLN